MCSSIHPIISTLLQDLKLTKHWFSSFQWVPLQEGINDICATFRPPITIFLMAGALTRVDILINQVYEWVYFFNDQVYDWGRFQKFGPHTRTTITPQLPPPPPGVKVVGLPLELIELGKNGAFRKSGCFFRGNRTEKVGAFRANKSQKGGFTAAHTRTDLIWEYPPHTHTHTPHPTPRDSEGSFIFRDVLAAGI